MNKVTKMVDKSLLAKLLATENIRYQHSPNTETAYFDVKTRTLVLPVWKNVSDDLYDMLVVHEVGHALETPPDGWVSAVKDLANRFDPKNPNRLRPIAQSILNITEDARIDRLQKERYPGSRRNYTIGYKELFDRNFFGTNGKDLDKLNFLDRANLYFKGGTMLGMKFTPEEQSFLDRMNSTMTFDEVVSLSEELYRFCKDQIKQEMEKQKEEQEKQKNQSGGSGEQQESDESGDGDGEESNEGEESKDGSGKKSGREKDKDKKDGKGRGSSEDKESKEEKGEGQSGDKKDEKGDGESSGKEGKDGKPGESEKSKTRPRGFQNSPGGKGISDADVPEPVATTEEAFSKASRNIIEKTNEEYIYCSLPEAKLENIVDDYKVVLKDMVATGGINKVNLDNMTQEAVKFRKEEQPMVSYMIKEFEQRKAADIYAKTATSQTGMLDTNRLHSYRFNEDVFKRVAVVPKGKNHGFVMFLDWSGSMSDTIKNTVKQLLTLTMFCRQMQIPFEVYLFRNLRGGSNERYRDHFVPAKGTRDPTIGLEPLKLRNILSSRMSSAELMQASGLLLHANYLGTSDPMGGTPLNSAIIAAEGLINNFRKRHALQVVNTIFLTDGDSNNATWPMGRNGNSSFAARRYFISDQVSKQQFEVEGRRLMHSGTAAFLKILQARTGCNLLGFFLLDDPQNLKTIVHRYGANGDAKVDRYFAENNFYPLQKAAGYDEYYIMKSGNARVSSQPYFAADDKTSQTSRLGQTFTDAMLKKQKARVLLRRFIENISKIRA